MNNLAKVFDFNNYKNKLEVENSQINKSVEQKENQLSNEEMFHIMMEKINSLEKQIEETKPKVKKEKVKIEKNGEMQQVKEYNKITIKDDAQIEIIEKAFLNYAVDNKYKISRLKNYTYFIFALNVGLRSSDILTLKFKNIIKYMDLENNLIVFRDEIGKDETNGLLESKTMNTKGMRKNRHISINDNVKRAISMYLENNKNVGLDDYIFSNLSVNSNNKKNKPMTVVACDAMLKKFDERSELNLGLNTHCCRRSFGFRHYMEAGGTHEALLFLQEIFGHSDSTQTLRYIGITSDDISKSYLKNNIGMKFNIFDEIGKLNK